MEPLEIEKKLKEKLSNRTLHVSEGAWDRLEVQLAANTQKKGIKKQSVLMIAASFVGILILGSLLMNQELGPANDIMIVNTQEKDTVKTVLETKKDNELVFEQPNPQLIDQRNEKEKTTIKEEVVVSEFSTSDTPEIQKKQQQKLIVNQEVVVNETPEIHNDILVDKNIEQIEVANTSVVNDSIVTSKVAEIVQSLATTEGGIQEVSEAEIDVLLVQAQQEILIQKQQKKYHRSYQTVDATALLLDVEAELDQSFKEQVFEALKTSFNKVRTAMRR